MKKIKIILIFFLITCSVKAENHVVTYGTKSKDTKINIKIYSSLTCPYCAELHVKFLPNLIKKYVENKIAYIELHDYPLNQSSLVAAQIQKCFSLDEIYKKQTEWSNAETLKKLQSNLSKITQSLGLSDKDFNSCLKNKAYENRVLKSRINAQNKYNVNSTPTLIINEKKFKGSLKNIEKYIQKLL